VGIAAKYQSVIHNNDTFYAIKRPVGRVLDYKTTHNDINNFSYNIFKAPNGHAWLETTTAN